MIGEMLIFSPCLEFSLRKPSLGPHELPLPGFHVGTECLFVPQRGPPRPQDDRRQILSLAAAWSARIGRFCPTGDVRLTTGQMRPWWRLCVASSSYSELP